MFTGCNIENASFGPTICAERTAVAKAVSEGHRDFVRIVIAGRSRELCVPRGVCRQVLREFAPNIEIICLNGAGEERTFTAWKNCCPTALARSTCRTAPAEGALRILKLEPVDFCCGEVLAESQIWVLAGPDRKAPSPAGSQPPRPRSWPSPRRFLPPVGSAHLNQIAAGAEAPAAWAFILAFQSRRRCRPLFFRIQADNIL